MLRYIAEYPDVPRPLKVGDHVLEWRQLCLPDGLVWVPNYISRIDAHNTHCWTVRINRQNEPKLNGTFSDSVYGSTVSSYHAALRFLKDRLPEYRPHDCLMPGQSTMIRVYRYYRRFPGVAEYRAIVSLCCRHGKRKQITMSIGTANTITYARALQKLRLAVGLRLWAHHVIRVFGRSVLWKSEIPTHSEIMRQFKRQIETLTPISKREYRRMLDGEVINTRASL